MEKQIFKYGSYSYEYFLIKQARKTVSLVIYPNLKIVLKCPMDYKAEKIQKFLKRKWSWLEKQIKYFKKYKKDDVIKEYISGESFLYLGRQYKLMVKKAKEDKVSLKHGKLLYLQLIKLAIKSIIKRYYKIGMQREWKKYLLKSIKKY